MKKIEIDLPEIDGFEYTGEYRRPRKGEWFIASDDNSFAICASYDWDDYRLILKKKAPVYASLATKDDHGFIFSTGCHIEMKWVEKNALVDAMKLVDAHIKPMWSDETKVKIEALKELIK